MDKKEKFVKEVENHLYEIDEHHLKNCFIEVVSMISENEYDSVLEILKETEMNNKPKVYPQKMSEEIVKEKMKEYQNAFTEIEETELYLEADGYEDYDNYYSDELIWEYRDTMGVIRIIESAMSFAEDCVNDYRYFEAKDILEMLWLVNVRIISEFDVSEMDLNDLIKENLVSINRQTFAHLLLYVVYQTTNIKDRPVKLYSFFTDELLNNIHIEDMRQVGRENLKKEDVFWDDWISFLMQVPGKTSLRLLKEATLYTGGVEMLLSTARKVVDIHPNLFLYTLELYKENRKYKEMVNVGNESLSIINNKYKVRSEIAVLTSYAAYHLKERKLGHLWFEAFQSDSTETNYLRLFQTKETAELYGLKAQTIDLKKIKEFQNNNLNIEQNELQATTEINLAFLTGNFSKVKEVCINPEKSLGWSGGYIEQGIFEFLLYLFQDNDLSTSLTYVANKLMNKFGFYVDDGFIDDNKIGETGNIEIFWKVFHNWKTYFPMSVTEQHQYVTWIEPIIKSRVTAIVDGQFRHHYKRVAFLPVALGEVKESLGMLNAREHLVSEFKSKFPRHRAFHDELRLATSN